jgi:DNA repair exonuclease SbcCD ATPase subunit
LIRTPLSIAAVGLLVAVFPRPVRADLSDEIQKADKQMEALEGKTKLIRHEYLQFEDKALGIMRFESRLNDGQSLMLLKDYVRAAIIFYDLVEDGKNQDHPGYADALYSLGEALFFNRNYIDARKYFTRVLEDQRGRPYRKLVLVRLMQIAIRTKEFDKVDAAHASLGREGAKISPQAQYLWGKTQFLRDRLQEAAKTFSGLQPGESFYFQARYYLGVVFIRQKRLEDALNLYTALVKQPTKRDQDQSVIELAHLARGRILHDLGRETEALDAYQAIEHTSVHFDEALFEICWTYIHRAGRAEQPEERRTWLQEALRTIEILEVSTPDSTLVPRANLLKGHIYEKMERFDDAAQSFMRVSHTYSTVKQELDELIARHDDPVRYFNEVAGKNLDTFDLSSYLPPLAVKWMSRHDDMAAALGVMKDIETGRRFVREARALLDKLNELLKNEDRINLFPALREGAKRTFEVENARVILERNLAHLEERIVQEFLTVEERKLVAAARREREQLEKQMDKLPTTKKQFDDRETRIRRKIEKLEKEVYESGIALKGMKAQLSAMEEWIRRNEFKLVGREEAIRDFREELRRGWATANQLQAELDQLSNLLGTEKARAGMDRATLTEEQKLREQYSQALKKERDLSERIHSRLGSEGSTLISRINELHLRADRLRKEIKAIRRDLDEKVLRKAEKLKTQVKAEEQKLLAFEEALTRLEKESENLAGEVAYQALEEVRQRFYRLVLDADVGILDVAWSRKQTKTDKITELGRKLGSDRKRLHDEFKSVLKEVE